MSETIELESSKNRNTTNGNIKFLGTPYGVLTGIKQDNDTVTYGGNEEEVDSNNETVVNNDKNNLFLLKFLEINYKIR